MQNNNENAVKLTLQPGFYEVKQPTTIILPPETSVALAGDDVTSLITSDSREAEKYYNEVVLSQIGGKCESIERAIEVALKEYSERRRMENYNGFKWSFLWHLLGNLNVVDTEQIYSHNKYEYTLTNASHDLLDELSQDYDNGAIERGSGNVYADLGFSNPEEWLEKSGIVIKINEMATLGGFSDEQLSNIIKLDVETIKELRNGQFGIIDLPRFKEALQALSNYYLEVHKVGQRG